MTRSYLNNRLCSARKSRDSEHFWWFRHKNSIWIACTSLSQSNGCLFKGYGKRTTNWKKKFAVIIMARYLLQVCVALYFVYIFFSSKETAYFSHSNTNTVAHWYIKSEQSAKFNVSCLYRCEILVCTLVGSRKGEVKKSTRTMVNQHVVQSDFLIMLWFFCQFISFTSII